MRIGVDLDGCVYDWTEAMRSYIHETTGRPREQMPPPTTWHFAEQWGLTDDELMRLYAQGVDEGFVLRIGRPIAGSLEALQRLREKGHSLHIVTDRGVGVQPEVNTCGWLAEWAVPFDSLTFSAHKTCVATDVFIDDKPANVLNLREEGCLAYLLVSEHNRAEGITEWWRVYSWEEFEQMVDAFTDFLATPDGNRGVRC